MHMADEETNKKQKKTHKSSRCAIILNCPCCNQSKRLDATITRAGIAVAVCALPLLVGQFKDAGIGLDDKCSFAVCSSCDKHSFAAIKFASSEFPDVPLFGNHP
jgi:hypothetical protein